MAPISGKKMVPKESIKTQKVTNAPKLIGQSEPPAPKEIMVDKTIRNDVSILSGGIGASVTPERCIPGKKNSMK